MKATFQDNLSQGCLGQSQEPRSLSSERRQAGEVQRGLKQDIQGS